MNIAIMQPYIFPYLGYFNLIYHSDTFVIYNDVNFIERGWINRNRIISKNGPLTFTAPVVKASSNKLISDLYFLNDRKWVDKFLKTLELTYKKAPFFNDAFELIESIIKFNELKLDEYLRNSIEKVLRYTDVERQICFSSEINYDKDIDKKNKLVQIANRLNAVKISFPEGSIKLYPKKYFEINNIQTEVVIPSLSKYVQFRRKGFISGLSIIDVLMFNSKEEVLNHFKNYTLSDLNEVV